MLSVMQEKKAKTASLTGAVRIAVIGCGAMSRGFHIPILAGHDGVQIAALVDRDVKRTRHLARDYGIAHVFADAAELNADTVDAAIIATPPWHHAPCTLDLVRRGIHVLVEKPVALTAADVEEMVGAADEAGVVLAAGHFRRLFPSVRFVRAVLESGVLGRVIGFDAEEGGEYGWRLATLSNLRKDQGGGGVLIDIGSHVLDELFYVLPGAATVLEYRDNSLGGIETDCRLRFAIEHEGNAIE